MTAATWHRGASSVKSYFKAVKMYSSGDKDKMWMKTFKAMDNEGYFILG